MSESYSKPIQDEITQKYHWVNGLDEYLIQNNYPFQQGIKTGFQANKNLV